MWRLIGIALSLFASLAIGTAVAAPLTEARAVKLVLTAPAVPADIFAQSFLDQVPLSGSYRFATARRPRSERSSTSTAQTAGTSRTTPTGRCPF